MIARFTKYHHKLPALMLSSLPLQNTHKFIYGLDVKYVYFGEMAKGGTKEKNGRGVKVNKHGSIFIGHWQEDRMNGQGRAVWSDRE
jgi:hypothetical protein